jgi:hypothetical protein
MLLLTPLLLALSSCGGREAARVPDTSQTPSASPSITPSANDSVAIETHARDVLAALKARDGTRLATYVHPTRGVRFSPYAYVRPDSDVVISRADALRLFSDSTKRVWGQLDGSGLAINETFAGYYRRFVYNADFATAPSLAFDRPPVREGNTPSNLRTVYPEAHWMEFHFPGFKPRYDGMDWSSLWLVFERVDRDWLLVGVVHGSWTI